MKIGFAGVGRTYLLMMDYFKILNRTALVLLIIFVVWYYLPENREVRGIDHCQYYTVQENVTCKCIAQKAGYIGVTKYFYPNGSVYQSKARKTNEVRLREKDLFLEEGGFFNVTR